MSFETGSEVGLGVTIIIGAGDGLDVGDMVMVGVGNSVAVVVTTVGVQALTIKRRMVRNNCFRIVSLIALSLGDYSEPSLKSDPSFGVTLEICEFFLGPVVEDELLIIVTTDWFEILFGNLVGYKRLSRSVWISRVSM